MRVEAPILLPDYTTTVAIRLHDKMGEICIVYFI